MQTNLVICGLALPKGLRMQSMEIELLSLETGLLLITVEAMCVAELWCMHMGLQERAIHSSFPKIRTLRPFFWVGMSNSELVGAAVACDAHGPHLGVLCSCVLILLMLLLSCLVSMFE
jgi:hypothetical protein